jgi:hypothetical protein
MDPYLILYFCHVKREEFAPVGTFHRIALEKYLEIAGS